MSTGLPKRFDPERLAAQDAELAGELDTGSMQRLQESLATDEAARIRVTLQAHRDQAKRLLLTGAAKADLDLVCQRCMDAVSVPVNAQFTLAVVEDEAAARNLPAEIDPLLLIRGDEVDLPALVEDELILALPTVPVHQDEADCGERAQYGREADEASGRVAKRENPFAVLKNLKNGKH